MIDVIGMSIRRGYFKKYFKKLENHEYCVFIFTFTFWEVISTEFFFSFLLNNVKIVWDYFLLNTLYGIHLVYIHNNMVTVFIFIYQHSGSTER